MIEMDTEPITPMTAPMPYFGGKRRVAALVWSRLGNVPNYIEPFAGSLAVLLGRPHKPKIETVNDIDAFMCNLWRAIQAAPDEVAKHADWPVNETDLYARHNWLINKGKPIVEELRADPEFYDAKIAGWYLWGACQWIGAGWCSGKSSWGKEFADGELAHDRLPKLSNQVPSLSGAGIHSKMPRLSDAGVGVHSERVTAQKGPTGLPDLAGTGKGIHSKRPHLSDACAGIHASGCRAAIYDYMDALSARLRGVRVCCGDWSRICGPTPTTKNGLTGVFLDPPYIAEGRTEVYSHDNDVSAEVREWALERGADPMYRIALCSYGEAEMPGWTRVCWSASGGYGNQGSGNGKANRHRETIDFSPHCLENAQRSLDLL